MPLQRAYVCLDRKGKPVAACIVLDDRHAHQAIKELRRLKHGTTVACVSVEAAYELMGERDRALIKRSQAAE